MNNKRNFGGARITACAKAAILGVLILSLPAMLSAQSSKPQIHSTTVNYDVTPNRLTITGANLVAQNTAPTVTIDAKPIGVVSFSSSTIVANLPEIAPGTYRLVVNGKSGSDQQDVTLGSIGPEGPAGPAGPAGPIGPMGPVGPMGMQGPAGPQGVKGETGSVGPQGPAGPEGQMGPHGQPGPTGAQGPAGPAGPIGPAGPAGANYKRIALLRWYQANLAVEAGLGEFWESPKAMVFDGRRVWVAGGGVNQFGDTKYFLRAFDAYDNDFGLGLSMPFTEQIYSIAYDGRRLWMSMESGIYTIRPFAAPPDDQRIKVLDGGGVRLIFDGEFIWLGGQTGVAKVGALNGSPIIGYSVCSVSEDRRMAFDGAFLWVTCKQDNMVVRINPSDGSIVGTVSTISKPTALAFDGEHMWVASADDQSVTKVRADGTFVGKYAATAAPEAVVFDGTHIWVVGTDVVKLHINDGVEAARMTQVKGLAAAFDGANVWVATAGPQSVLRKF